MPRRTPYTGNDFYARTSSVIGLTGGHETATINECSCKCDVTYCHARRDSDVLRRVPSIICDLTGRHAKQGRSTVKRISEQSARTEGPNSGRSTGAPRRERRLRRRTKATTAPPTEGKAPPPADALIKCVRRAPVASR